MSELYHYTCDHGHQTIGDSGKLLPAFMLTDRPVPWTGFVVWMTDLAAPSKNGLGLTSNFIHCDRIAHRYRITDATEVMPWHRYARNLSRDQREDVETTLGALPAHWFVAVCGIPAIYDPLKVRAA